MLRILKIGNNFATSKMLNKHRNKPLKVIQK